MSQLRKSSSAASRVPSVSRRHPTMRAERLVLYPSGLIQAESEPLGFRSLRRGLCWSARPRRAGTGPARPYVIAAYYEARFAQ